jgi:hypothetical protein
MKYRTLRAMAHNLSHSFLSGMNVVDGRPAFEDVYQRARKQRGEKVIIRWVPERDDEHEQLSDMVRRSIAGYRAGLPEFFASNGVEAAAIAEFWTEVWVDRSFRMQIRAVVIDDRGKEHAIVVRPL